MIQKLVNHQKQKILKNHQNNGMRLFQFKTFKNLISNLIKFN
jgi:hypothetical protein